MIIFKYNKWIIKTIPDKRGLLFFFFFKILFIYLTERDPAREGIQAVGEGEEEAGFPTSREPNVELHPRTLGS